MDAASATVALVANHPLNVLLPTDSRAWLVGDAAVFYIDRRVTYHTVFNRDPWVEFARDHDAAAAATWLRERRVTHVVFNWPEIERLLDMDENGWRQMIRGTAMKRAKIKGLLRNLMVVVANSGQAQLLHLRARLFFAA